MFKALPLNVARQVAFCLMPHKVESLVALVEWLLAYPICFISLTLEVDPSDAAERVDKLKRVLAWSECPSLDITLSCRDGYDMEVIRALLESRRVEAVGFKSLTLDPDCSDELIQAFADSRNAVHSLKVQFSRSTLRGSMFFTELLRRDDSIFYLDASCWGYDYVRYPIVDANFFKSLNRAPSLFYLHLQNVGLDAEATRLLCQALATQRSLKLLDIGNNSIGDEGACALAECLKTQTTLCFLVLNFCEVTSVGAVAIAQALETNTALDMLYMKDDDLGSEGGTAFATMLKVNTTLRRLHLEYCNFQREGCKSFIEAVAINRTLKHLKITHSGITLEDKVELVRVANEGKALEILKVDDKKNELGEHSGSPSRYTCIASYSYLFAFETNYARHLCSSNRHHSKGPPVVLE